MFTQKKYKFEIVTPLLIGNGQELNPFDCVEFNKKIYVLDFIKFSNLLKEKSLIDEFSSSQEKINDFLQKHNLLNSETLELISKNILLTSGNVKTNEKIILCAKDGFYKPYIPGSSIKGYLRTAVLYRYLKHDEQVFEKVKNKIERNLQDPKITAKNAGEFLNKLFNNYILVNDNYQQKKIGMSPYTDIFRTIHVSDAYFEEEIKTTVFEIILKKLKNNKFEKDGIPIFGETIPDNHKGFFTITFDEKLFNIFESKNLQEDLLFNSLKDIELSVKEFSVDMIEKEIEFFNKYDFNIKNWYEQNKKNLHIRLGMDTGLLFKTIIGLFDDDLKRKICKRYFNKEFYLTFPRTREFVDNKPMGWIKIIDED